MEKNTRVVLRSILVGLGGLLLVDMISGGIGRLLQPKRSDPLGKDPCVDCPFRDICEKYREYQEEDEDLEPFVYVGGGTKVDFYQDPPEPPKFGDFSSYGIRASLYLFREFQLHDFLDCSYNIRTEVLEHMLIQGYSLREMVEWLVYLLTASPLP